MFERNTILAGMVLAISLGAPALAEDVTRDTVVATVNGNDITVGHMVATRRLLPQQYQELPDDVLFDGILDQLIQQSVLAGSLGPELSPVAKLMIENETRTILAGQALDGITSVAVTEDAVKAAYEAKYANSEPTKEYNASHILLETEEKAQEMIDLIAEGSVFADLAREHSTGPSGPNGGELGWFGTGVMVPEFETAVTTLEVGAVSEPIQTQFGWHVVILNETRLQDGPPLEEVQDELKADIQNAAVEAAIESLTAESEVTRIEAGTVDPGTLSSVAMN